MYNAETAPFSFFHVARVAQRACCSWGLCNDREGKLRQARGVYVLQTRKIFGNDGQVRCVGLAIAYLSSLPRSLVAALLSMDFAQ